ncbi:MAG: OB-fold nucleic acid binding domain-containing protein [Nocardioides sp.]|uniref:OB-fold nucleic acid binding domain-containing protein n=1 Tax=Nocardioides sp. TaxID=35761 RepID=UPI0039E5B7EA
MRDRISAWANPDNIEAQSLREAYEGKGCTRIADAPDRQVVSLRGTLRTVTLRPRGGVPALEAELFDGSGMVTIIWLGRRRIAGIVPGRSVQVDGRVGVQDGVRVLYNPRYELIP